MAPGRGRTILRTGARNNCVAIEVATLRRVGDAGPSLAGIGRSRCPDAQSAVVVASATKASPTSGRAATRCASLASVGAAAPSLDTQATSETRNVPQRTTGITRAGLPPVALVEDVPMREPSLLTSTLRLVVPARAGVGCSDLWRRVPVGLPRPEAHAAAAQLLRGQGGPLRRRIATGYAPTRARRPRYVTT